MDVGKPWGNPNSPLEDSPWVRWLQEIACLPSDSPYWNSVEDFLNEVRRIAADKEREQAAHKTLRKALDVASEYSAELKYFRFERPASWNVSRISGRDVVSSIEEVTQLAKALAKARELRKKPCDTIEEDDQRQTDLRALHEGIQVAYNKLNTLLSPAEKQMPPPLADQPTSPSPLENSTVADLRSALEKNDSSPAESAPEKRQVLSQPQDVEIPISEPLSPGPLEVSVKALSAQSQDVPPVDVNQGDGFALSNERLCELTDQKIGQAILQANSQGRGEDARSLLVEQQLRWLMKGQNLRAYIATCHMEEHGTGLKQPGDIASQQSIPSWLCWFALLISDPGASRLDFDIAEFIPYLTVLGQQPESHQRFFLAWLCTGLLGNEAPRCIQAAQNLSKNTLEADWLDESPFYRFCVDHLASPATRGHRPQMSMQDSPESLGQEYQKEITDASVIVSLHNYQNTYVTKYWLRLVGKEGPVRTLLVQAKSSSLSQTLPEPEELAASVDGWLRVQASYRTNILNRLSTFLNHLRAATSLHRTLQSQAPANPFVLRPDQIVNAIRDGEVLVNKLAASRCPSLAGYRTVIERLKMLAPGEGT